MAGARAVLLLITVALFAAAWSGDHPDEAAMAAQAEPAPATSALDLGPLVQSEPIAPSAGWETRFAAWENAVNPTDRWLPLLPTGITPGTYLIVHPQGQTERVCVDADMLQTFGHDPDVTPSATLTLVVDGANYVLVRIQTTPERAVIAEGFLGRRRM